MLCKEKHWGVCPRFGVQSSRGDPRGDYVVGLINDRMPTVFWIYEVLGDPSACLTQAPHRDTRCRAPKLDTGSLVKAPLSIAISLANWTCSTLSPKSAVK
jgi:hypothetical protein